MDSQNISSETMIQQTRFAFLWTRILSMPCWSLISILSVILYKDMHIAPFQITTIIALKPISALFAPYWTIPIYRRQDRLIPNLILASILQYLPLLFFPWFDSAWMMIMAFGLYMLLNRGVIPAWMEIFKQNIPPVMRERIFSYGSIVDYLGCLVLPLGLGLLLDNYSGTWRWIFPLTGLLGLGSIYFLRLIPISMIKNSDLNHQLQNPFVINQKPLLQPWKQAWKLINERPDFARFQLGFMLGGGGLMIMQPALPLFFVDVLNLSFTKMAVSIAVCKGIGFILTAPLWAKFFNKIDIYRFSGIVTILATLFPLILLSSQIHSQLLCLAYLAYGIMQAGSELSWHMSGPVFAKEEDSSIFSRTNVLTVGMRGCLFPFLGSWLYTYTDAPTVMIAGAILCSLATYQLLSYSPSPITSKN